MTVKLSVDNQAAVEEVTARLAAFQRTFNDLRIAWHTIGVKVQEHISERWTSGYGQLAPLRTSTLYAKAKRHGYYKRAPGSAPYLRRTGEKAFWWTGDALRTALGSDAFRADRSQLVFDFGRDSEPRRNLERMHFGGHARPAREVYDIDAVAEIADEWLNRFVDQQLQAANLGKTGFARS